MYPAYICIFLHEHVYENTTLAVIDFFINNNINIKPDKIGSNVIMDFTRCNHEIMELINDKNTYKQISLDRINKNTDIFNNFHKI